MSIKSEISKAIKHQRLIQGISIDDLSHGTKISGERIVEIEGGFVWPSDLELESFLNAFNMTLFELVGCSQATGSLCRKLMKLRKDRLPLVESAIDGLLQSQSH